MFKDVKGVQLICLLSLISICWGVPSLDQCWGSKGLCSRRHCFFKIEPFIEQSTSRKAKWTSTESITIICLFASSICLGCEFMILEYFVRYHTGEESCAFVEAVTGSCLKGERKEAGVWPVRLRLTRFHPTASRMEACQKSRLDKATRFKRKIGSYRLHHAQLADLNWEHANVTHVTNRCVCGMEAPKHQICTFPQWNWCDVWLQRKHEQESM